MSEKKKNEVAKKEDNAVVASEDEALALAKSMGLDSENNFDGGETPELPIIKVKHSAQMFETQDGEKSESIEAVLIYKHRCNVYWEKDIDEGGGGSVPDCASIDAVKPTQGDSIQSDTCAECPNNKFGSDKDGNGKACKNQIRSFWLLKGNRLPQILMVPPSSLKQFSRYLTVLTNKGYPYPMVKTLLTLDKRESNGQEYSIINLKIADLIKDKESLGAIKKARDEFMEHFTDDLKSEAKVEGEESPF